MHPAAAKELFDRDVASLSTELARRRHWIIHAIEFPTIDCSFTADGRTSLRVRFMCNDWNDLPPSITLHAADGSFLTAALANPTGVFHPGPHPITNRFFVCMRGSREYHTHPSHVNDPWDKLNGTSNYDLGGILTQVWRAWQKGKT